MGFSRQTGLRIAGKIQAEVPGWRHDNSGGSARSLPDPKPWGELDDVAREALRDIHVFREVYLARRRQVWVYDAAMRIVEALQDESRRTFIDLNVFPGAGKTFLCMDVGAWLVCGGGFCDPRRGRALRIMYGSEVMKVSVHMVKAVRNWLTLRRPFYDHAQARSAERVLAEDFGRFRPVAGFDPDSQWTQEQFVVAQLGLLELYEKEPTFQAASYRSGFLGERVNAAFWDDIATTKNSSTPDAAEAVDVFFANEAEKRVEPGGVLGLIGQRLGPMDLHAKRKAATRRDGTHRYQHIIFPAHWDEFCDGDHRQWDGTYEAGHGCLTDEWRLPVTDWEDVLEEANYDTVYQQKDVDPERVLVQIPWLDGGTDLDGFDAMGCYDPDRAFGEHPRAVGPLVNYASVDPSPANFWAIEWWAYQPTSRFNYLIWGERRKMPAGTDRGLLDWNNAEQRFVGWMEELQMASVAAGQPIRCWVLETNIAQRWLTQFEHYRRWRQRWPYVQVIKHETQGNKNDPTYGVSVLSTRYKTGYKRLPRVVGIEGRNFMRILRKELTTYVLGIGAETDDCVMADWMGEFNLPRIVSAARRDPGGAILADAKLPPYLRRQQHEVATAGYER